MLICVPGQRREGLVSLLPGEKFQSISSPLKLANLEPEAQDVLTFSYLGRCSTSRMKIDTPAASLLKKVKMV